MTNADRIAELQIRGDALPPMERLYIRTKTRDPRLCRCRRCRKLVGVAIPDLIVPNWINVACVVPGLDGDCLARAAWTAAVWALPLP